MGAYISRLWAAVGATVGAIARGFGGGIGLGNCAGKGGPGVVAHQKRQHPFQKWEEGRKVLGENPGIGSVVRGYAVQHKGKSFKCFEKHLEILKRCLPLATPCQALGSQQVFLLMTDQA